jgi:hypothetical protein
MKTKNNARSGRLRGLSVRRASPQWRETEPVDMDNISDDVVDDRFSHGYHNQDYSPKNFWPPVKDRETYSNDEGEPTGYIESQNKRQRTVDQQNEAVGYGNENSLSAQEFYNMKYGSEGTDREKQFRNRKHKSQQKSLRPDPEAVESNTNEELDLFEDVSLKKKANIKEFGRSKRPNIRDKK